MHHDFLRPPLLAATALALLLLGCGGDEHKSILDPNSFSGMHEAELTYDCQESVNCFNQRGQLPAIEGNQFTACIEASAAMLEGDAQRQMQFVNNFQRCSAFVSCQYYDCASANASSSYGATQLPKVMHHCSAKVACQTLQGILQEDPTVAQNNCEGFGVSTLDNLSAAERLQYEQDYMMCAALTGCEFVSCFQH
ncbi:MAG: hypothetical protein OEZ06_01070 [Myxococcales bacterium]|nr:hypothetical protein [Myxococcales bacterium]